MGSRNKMDAKNMAVVLCPNLYENNDSMQLQGALLRFTEFAIRSRIQFRKNNPVQKINDMLAIQAGLTPGIANQKQLQKQLEDEYSLEEEDEIGSHDVNENKILSAEEGDGFAGAIYSGSRFRGSSMHENDSVPGKLKSRVMGDVDDVKYDNMEPPPPAYSDYGSGDD